MVSAWRWRRGPFGLAGPFGFGWRDGCLAGVPAACEAYFAAPERDRTDLARLRARRWGGEATTSSDQVWFSPYWRDMHGDWHHLFAELYAEFGPASMQRFWASEADASTAFHIAFGIEAGPWFAERIRRERGYVPPGPLPRPRGLLWALAAIVAFGAVAAAIGSRRSLA